MNDTPTPRTDEVAEGYWYSEMLNHAERLERELNAAMQAIRDIYANEYNSLETYTICERILRKEEHWKP
jgi:hypothetical protein